LGASVSIAGAPSPAASSPVGNFCPEDHVMQANRKCQLWLEE
jgi:hypothetical protein